MEHPEVVSSSALMERLRSGAAVITGNIRLSRSLLLDFERNMTAAGHLAWRTPTVLPYVAWLQELRDSGILSRERPLARLLTQDQEAHLWEAAIKADHPGLLRTAATARTAQRSWQRMQDWGIDLESGAFGVQENARAFRRWARRFVDLCRARKLVAAAGLENELVHLLEEEALTVPGRIVLVGFYELTPSQRALFSALGAAGCEVSRVTLKAACADCCRTRARDEEHELQMASAWAGRCLEENPGARIGIVVPELEKHREALARQLRAHLSPGSLPPGVGHAAQPWNISLGRPLAEYPVIETALLLLGLMDPVIRLESLGPLLTSPWWAMPRARDRQLEESSRRALLDRELRARGEDRYTLRAVHYHAGRIRTSGEPAPGYSERLAGRLGEMIREQSRLPGAAGAGEWAMRFSQWLAAAAWCGGARLDSAAFQAVERWHGLLSAFSGLDDFVEPLSRSAATALLARMARETTFQPRGGNVSVQVLGLYEANEQQFDRLWVMGLHDAQWPPPATPDPFIPAVLQREHRLPGGDPDWELERARHLMAQWEGAAERVVFSHPGTSGDAELQGSPLLQAYPGVEPEDLLPDAAIPWLRQLSGSARLEPVAERALGAMSGERAKGGARILESFSACPFKAQAEHRLGARPLQRPVPGLDAKRRGSLLHRVMELFWRDLVSHDTLLSLSPNALQRRTAAAVQAAVEEQIRSNSVTLGRRFADLEARRLRGLLAAWLEVEKQRAPFRVIGFEQEAIVVTGGLSLRVKLDRLDQVEDGSLLIIDYKTGRVSPGGWFGERLDDPQLPLYSLTADDEKLAGVAFAQMRAGQIGFNGVVKDDSKLPGLPPNRRGPQREAMERWPAVLQEWSQVLGSLAAQFRAGHSEVDPKRGLQTCTDTYCELARLCRIHTAVSPGESDQ